MAKQIRKGTPTPQSVYKQIIRIRGYREKSLNMLPPDSGTSQSVASQWNERLSAKEAELTEMASDGDTLAQRYCRLLSIEFVSS